MRLLLVDDHPRFREGIRARLGRAGLEIVAEAGDGAAAVALAVEHEPDVVLMDLNMPGPSGSEATAEIVRRAPGVRVLMLTIASDEASVAEAMLAGACGYVVKSAGIAELADGIRAAAAGETFLSPPVAAILLGRWRQLEEAARPTPTPPTELSERELEVLRLIASGQENTEIAAQLSISPNTVKRHVASILAKLRTGNRTEAAVQAVRDRLI